METRFGGARVSEAVPLAPLTTLRVGPVAREFVAAATVEQIVAALTELDADPDRRVLVLAGGSNVLLADDLTDLTVVHLGADAVDIDGATVRVQAGALWDDVVAATVTAGLGGLECLSGIPGSAGATPVQNVGAYGAEVADTLTAVRLLDRRSGTVEWVDPARLAFGYRSSILKHSDRHVVLEAEFTLDPAGRSAPLRYGELATALGAEPGNGPIRPPCVPRCWPCAPARAWCSTPPTTTPGVRARSSPTRWSTRRSTSGSSPPARRRCRTTRPPTG